MLTVTDAQLDAWLAALMFPLVRILGMVSSAPLFGNRGIPLRVRVAIGLGVAVAVLPSLPPMPAVPPASGLGLAIMAQQFLIGVGIAIVMRITFAAVDVAGELVGLQMGLSFAAFFDPDSGGRTAVVAEFMGLITSLLFLALNGHLLLVEVVIRSFEWLPVATTPLHGGGWMSAVHFGATLFAAGLLLAMPIMATLLVVNIAMGVLTRAAPQLNIFAIGFPVTLGTGLLVLMLSMEAFAPAMRHFFDRGFEAVGRLLQSLL
ncbi:MAG: flagellar biosynthetic protein FliR [Rhodocyclaceae bacterium]|nr:flagellar biosynthetic protein FliR [Rhodocyclaceae bacterium]